MMGKASLRCVPEDVCVTGAGGPATHSLGETPERLSLHVPDAMGEAYHYANPAAFSRGMVVCLAGARLVFVSGTASVGPAGETLYPNDFRAQARRAFENTRAVLRSASADWSDVVKVTIYLRDISAHYAAFNEVRCAYFDEIGLESYPASTCVEARLCREELLVEMESLAITQDNHDHTKRRSDHG